ncbi:MAG: alpha-xylosidase [Streptococcaceae bacterium]|jgi:alpha-glucosidase (family GH31 glycosyl hydrolase)|nr:alpha-xylosidase [Streptococcaceae bacterium]
MKKNEIIFDKARFTVLTENLIRIEYSESEKFEDGLTQIVQNRNFEIPKFDVIKNDNGIEILTSSVRLYYSGGAFNKSSLFADARYNSSVYSNRWRFGERIEGNLGGTTRTLDQIDGTCPLDDGIMSKNGFAVLFDASMVLNASEDIVGTSSDQVDLYFFAYGREYRQALRDFYRLTGPVPKLPRWALGNWWSRFYEYSTESYLALMDKFAAKEVPLSVSVIDMDWHLTDEDVPSRFGSGWTGYTWNKKLFPEPKQLIDALHRRGLKVTLNDHPADGVRAFESAYPAVAKRLGLNPALEEPATFDFDNPEFRKAYFEDVHGPLEDDGVDFWWLDWQQGTVSKSGADPLWQLNRYQYEDSQKLAPNNLILSRYAGPGSHRYPIGFSGDTVISWASLDFQPYFTSTASNIGYTWWSHDIGGHMQGAKDAELTLRWMQYGVFSPINRVHSTKSEFTSKEPWHFDKVVEDAMENALRLRHQLIPYLYSANLLTAQKGRALVEPIYYEYPMEECAYTHKNQYLFGSELMLLPVTQKLNLELQMGEANIWFPEGTWYDFFTGEKYQGNVEFKIYREITEIPVFAKAGAIIPLDKNPLAGEDVPSELIWKVFPGAANEYVLHEDDNQTTVRFDGRVLTLTESKSTTRRHTLIYAGREVAADLAGNFEIDLGQFDSEFDWTFEAALLRRLDIAEIDFDEKDFIFNHLRKMTDFGQRCAFVKNIENIELQDALFEIIYSGKSCYN